ncbi:30S ribosomal protein S11 [Candidatus Pacearchaeota archaeon]|nr:30S ribosomal protein S11 [Candidatus Pacearchaeota archaeon]|tara:strand:- start:1975 stop:2364 length:390 start_codon:yes stop_codon:yes gene_type:complete
MAKENKDQTGILHISASYNNTLAHVTDLSGNTITKITGGMVTKQDRLKANPTTAMFIAKKIEEEVAEVGVKSLYVRMKGKTGSHGIGPGANAIIKTLSKDGFKILNIADVTKIPRGGPKKKGGRRGRRV